VSDALDRMQALLAERREAWRQEQAAEQRARVARIAAGAAAAATVTAQPQAPRPDPAPAEILSVFRSAEDASRILSGLPRDAGAGIRVISLAGADAERERMAAFWAAGGGRLPAEHQPAPAPPAGLAPRTSAFIRRCLEDGDTWA
jgi:hypothetical protein